MTLPNYPPPNRTPGLSAIIPLVLAFSAQRQARKANRQARK